MKIAKNHDVSALFNIFDVITSFHVVVGSNSNLLILVKVIKNVLNVIHRIDK